MQFLRSLFRRRPSPRLIFTYRAAGETRHADPLQLDRRLQAAGGEGWAALVVEVAKLRNPLPPLVAEAMGAEEVARRKTRFEAGVEKLVTMARAAFELPPLDPATGRGATEAECVAVLVDYLDFAEALAEAALPFPQ